MSKSSYINGDTVAATEFRLSNPGSQTAVKMRVWLKVPTVGEVDLISIGSDGSFQLPGNINVDLGPILLFAVTLSFPPKGSWEMNSRITNPTTNALISEDINPFTVR